MSKQKTYAAIILDKSGSMSGTRAQTVEGFNEHVQQFKEDAKDQDIFVSLVTFNGEVYEHLWNEPVDSIAEAAVEDYHTGGSTALRDAVGYTIDKLSETVQMDKDTSFLVIIISDGCENSSKHVSAEALKEKIDARQKTGDWTFSYMGCSERYLQQLSEQTAIPISNMAAWSNQDAVRTRGGMKESAKKMRRYMAARATGVKGMSMGLHSDNLEACANYEDAGVNDSVTSASDQTIGTSALQPPTQPPVMPSPPDQVVGGGNVWGGAARGDTFGVATPRQSYVQPPEQNEGTGYFAASKPVAWKTDQNA